MFVPIFELVMKRRLQQVGFNARICPNLFDNCLIECRLTISTVAIVARRMVLLVTSATDFTWTPLDNFDMSSRDSNIPVSLEYSVSPARLLTTHTTSNL